MRLEAPSFAKMDATWVLTVCSEMLSRCAISLLLSPSASRSSTSSSRSLSGSASPRNGCASGRSPRATLAWYHQPGVHRMHGALDLLRSRIPRDRSSNARAQRGTDQSGIGGIQQQTTGIGKSARAGQSWSSESSTSISSTSPESSDGRDAKDGSTGPQIRAMRSIGPSFQARPNRVRSRPHQNANHAALTAGASHLNRYCANIFARAPAELKISRIAPRLALIAISRSWTAWNRFAAGAHQNIALQ